MVDSHGEWESPPAYEHYSYDDLEQDDILFQHRLSRGVDRYSSSGASDFRKDRLELELEWKSHLFHVESLDLLYANWRPAEASPVPENRKGLSEVGPHLRELREWADTRLDIRSGGLDRLIHYGNDLAVQLAVSDAILKSARRRDALPLLSEPHWLRPATAVRAVEHSSTQTHDLPGKGKHPGRTSRTPHEDICAIADLHLKRKFRGLNTLSSIGTALERLKERSGGLNAKRGYARTAVMIRLPKSVYAYFGLDIVDTTYDNLIPFIEHFEEAGRPDAWPERRDTD
jgi:hypothetical protein